MKFKTQNFNHRHFQKCITSILATWPNLFGLITSYNIIVRLWTEFIKKQNSDIHLKNLTKELNMLNS